MVMGAPMKVFVALLILIGASLNSEFCSRRKVLRFAGGSDSNFLCATQEFSP